MTLDIRELSETVRGLTAQRDEAAAVEHIRAALVFFGFIEEIRTRAIEDEVACRMAYARRMMDEMAHAGAAE